MKKSILLFLVCTASLFFLNEAAWGDVWRCVSNAPGLHAALDASKDNGDDDVIMVQQGFYTGTFTYISDQGHSITLLGGYVPLTNCTMRVLNPANTVLNAQGSGRVLHLADTAGGDIFVEGFTVINGITPNDGGGIRASSYSSLDAAGDITINNNNISGNTATNGGGIYARSTGQTGSGIIALNSNIITGNTVYSSYGGVHTRSSTESGTAGDVTLTDNTIAGNTADGTYAGAYVESISNSGTAGDATLLHNTISGNSAGYGVGGVEAISRTSYSMAGDVILKNNTVTGNRANVYGGGIYAISWFDTEGGTAGDVILTNNTITGNTVAVRGSGLIVGMYDNTIYCYNNIIWGNTADIESGDDIRFYGSGTAYGYNNDYSDMVGDWTYSGGPNINADPLFVNPGYWDDNGTSGDPSDDFWVKGNYHLRPGSPCIDKGHNTPPGGLPEHDFEGDPRIMKGTVDMGADEFRPRSLISQFLLLLKGD